MEIRTNNPSHFLESSTIIVNFLTLFLKFQLSKLLNFQVNLLLIAYLKFICY